MRQFACGSRKPSERRLEREVASRRHVLPDLPQEQPAGSDEVLVGCERRVPPGLPGRSSRRSIQVASEGWCRRRGSNPHEGDTLNGF